jgi:hypothetical protein
MPHNDKVNIQLEAALKALLYDRPVAYHPGIARAVKSVSAGVLMAQLIYWSPRTRDPEGWFWKTRDEIEEETALGRWEQETARKVLKKYGVLEEKLKGVPARMHFRVNIQRLAELLSTIPEPSPTERQMPASEMDDHQVGIPPTSWMDSHQLDSGKASNKKDGLPPTITESTTENTNRGYIFDSMEKPTSKEKGHTNDRKLQKPTSLQDIMTEQLGVAGEKVETTPHTAREIAHAGGADISETPILDTFIDEVSEALGEPGKARSNRSRARKLLADQPDAVAAQYARRAYAQTREQLRDYGGVTKKMPYFFGCLEQLLAEPIPTKTTDLAGKYAAKVMR